MKRASIPILAMILFLVLSSAVAAAPPQPAQFTMTGYTTDFQYDVLPSGKTKFHITARGGGDDAAYDPICDVWGDTYVGPGDYTCAGLCALTPGGTCGIAGDLTGEFTYEEWGIVDLNYNTFEGSGRGVNAGLMTITTDSGTIDLRFGGQTDSQSVWGHYTVLRGSGDYKRLHGQGTYTGNAGLWFSVTFTGRFHYAPK